MIPNLYPNSDAEFLQIFLQPIFATPQFEHFQRPNPQVLYLLGIKNCIGLFSRKQSWSLFWKTVQIFFLENSLYPFLEHSLGVFNRKLSRSLFQKTVYIPFQNTVQVSLLENSLVLFNWKQSRSLFQKTVYIPFQNTVQVSFLENSLYPFLEHSLGLCFW